MALKPLQPNEVPRALDIIEQHDEDDREWAERSYDEGLAGQFGYHHEGELVGVSGYRAERDIAWISWTYLDKSAQSRGFGKKMLEEVILMLRKLDFRRVFVSTSDYQEDGIPVYAAAIKLYKSLGFQQEVFHPDYYEEGEGNLIFGYTLKANSSFPKPKLAKGMRLLTAHQIDETEDAFVLEWEPSKKNGIFSSRDLFTLYLKTLEGGARNIYISLPSSWESQFGQHVKDCHLLLEGRLKDYHYPSIDELRYRFTFQ